MVIFPLVNTFCKGSDSIYCKLCETYGHLVSSARVAKNSRKQYMNEWTWLCTSQNLCTKTDGGWVLVQGQQFAKHCHFRDHNL